MCWQFNFFQMCFLSLATAPQTCTGTSHVRQRKDGLAPGIMLLALARLLCMLELALNKISISLNEK